MHVLLTRFNGAWEIQMEKSSPYDLSEKEWNAMVKQLPNINGYLNQLHNDSAKKAFPWQAYVINNGNTRDPKVYNRLAEEVDNRWNIQCSFDFAHEEHCHPFITSLKRVSAVQVFTMNGCVVDFEAFSSDHQQIILKEFTIVNIEYCRVVLFPSNHLTIVTI